ncbi:hypothetical protein QA601_02690 [Chitinispirillales bacterium ANBcel5]|uniref:hypothetical protein n=1 Tax=Cellulosispirillum alkaliphilum TaxID=3039283 RepID=UPI002A58503C|nr:hypothetical protein [Chitinispirillales bacterium ANBcel5]
MSAKKSIILLVIVMMAQLAFSQTILTVSQDGEGMFSTISAALDAAGEGAVIRILDNAVYEEQVTIDSTHNGLTLTSSNPTSSSRPVIMWQDTENVHPMNITEAQNPDMINFDRNGALRVLRARGVTIDGIIVDGGGAMPFGYPGVWSDGGNAHPLFHGNSAICLWISGNVVIRNSDARNAFYGIAVKDRNEGGIYGNSNPADITPENVIPLSGFGRTGNHLIEHNHIHGNSWGIFMESVWDLGSTIRFNFLYNNYHQSSDIVSEVRGLGDGDHNMGGAMTTKDHILSPLAIYNNTFHNNYLTFGGQWRSGAQHLIFNNIYSRPRYLWADGYSGGEYTNPFHAMDPLYPNRMKHSIYAAQALEPVFEGRYIGTPPGCRMSGGEEMEGYTQVRLMNGIDGGAVQSGAVVTIECDDGSEVEVPTNDFISPGALFAASAGDPFPASANIRWFEIQNHFLNTDDPTHPDFLVPDWDHPTVDSIIKEAGWPEAGIVKGDGSIVDIGAAQSGPVPTVFGRITPVAPVLIDDNNLASLAFDLNIPPEFSNPRIKYLRFLRDVEFDDSFANNAPVIAASDIVDITPPSTPIRGGANSINVPVQGVGDYAFFEMVIEGEGPNGQTVTTDVGFLPYRELDYLFEVQVLDMGGNVLDTVRAGERVRLRLAPVDAATGRSFTETLTEVEVNLNSGYTLYRWPGEGEEPQDALEISQIIVSTQPEVVFTRVPRGGTEYISATASWVYGDRQLPFFGTADVVIAPGTPDNVVFEDPPSTTVSDEAPTIDPGSSRQVQVRVFDRFGNAVNVEAPVTIESLNPEIGDISGPATTTTDHTGAALFNAEVTNGNINDIFTLRATLTANGATDDGRLRVGRARDRLHIFYSDTLAFDENAEIRGEVGEKIPVVIRAYGGEAGDSLLEHRDTEIEITPDPGVAVFASPDATTQTRIFNLENGQVRVWITGTSVVDGATISAAPTQDNTLIMGFRDEIYFSQTPTLVDYGVVYADSGDGRVNRMEVYYLEELEELPDSIELFWPVRDEDNAEVRRVATSQYDIRLNEENPKHITVRFLDRFPPAITTFSGDDQLGTHFYTSKDPLIDPPLVEVNRFRVIDSVGPMISSGIVHERLRPGVDTLILRFTERLSLSTLEGQSLILIKSGTGEEFTLNVLRHIPYDDNQFKVVVEDLGDNAPGEGDFLKFSENVMDSREIPAHPNNTPVELGLRPIPPEVDSAYFYDTNADGIVNRVEIHFNKDVVLDSAAFTWIHNSETGTLYSDRFSYGETNATVIINMVDAFTENVADYTDGRMTGTLHFEGFSEKVTAIVRDRAAPVITEARYGPGRGLGEGLFAPDTLVVQFSEISETPSHNQPFGFITREGGQEEEYSMVLRLDSERAGQYYFLVDTIPGGFYPRTGDLIYINPVAQISDLEGNYQENADNKRVPLEVGAVPVEIQVFVGPSPYKWGQSVSLPENRGEFQGVLFRIDFRARVENIDIDVDLVVYDYLGNVVFSENLEQDPNLSYMLYEWQHPLRNQSGRHIGAGTYMAKIRVEGEGVDPEDKNHTKMFYVDK